MAELVNFQLETSQFEVDAERLVAEARRELHLERVEALEPIGHDPLLEGRFRLPVRVLGTATVDILAERIIGHWLDDKSQGVLIDFRTRPTRVSRIADIPPAFLVGLKPDGGICTCHRDAFTPAELAAVLSEWFKLTGS